MSKVLDQHGTLFDCGPVQSDARNFTMPGQFYFGDTAPEEYRGKKCNQCAFYRLEQKKGSKPKDDGNALKKAKAHRINKGFCAKHKDAMKRCVMFEGEKALPCKYFEPLGGGK